MHTSKVLASGIEVAKSVSAINNNLDVAKQALGVIDAVEAFKPFVPFIGMVTILAEDIFKVYRNAQHNRITCNAFLDRVEAARSLSIKILKCESFLEDATQLYGYKKFINENSVKERFESLTRGFLIMLCKDLHFTITVQRQNEIDKQNVQEDLKEIFYHLLNLKYL
nr:2853_t:CDS:2 [Entrophospora candida]